VDLIVYGTAHASREYGGGDLIQDIIAGREIAISVSAEGKTYESSIPGSDIPHARLFTTRSAFKNYTAVTNSSRTAKETIFSVTPLNGDLSEVTVSGCGEINPLENDPSLRFIRPGTPVLLNGGPGFVIGTGTRSSAVRPNIAVHGEMSGMDPYFCGGFKTSAGPECITSIATAIPVLDEAALLPLLVRDPDIPLPVVDLSDRQEIGMSHYGRVWQATSRSVRYVAESCLECSPCRAAVTCPVHAIHDRRIDQNACFVCGTCIAVCPGGCYTGTLGSLPVGDRTLPVRLRQSDRRRAEHLCDLMREKIFYQEMGI
jgi:putative methanogenesis marker 16 metalloprotein